MLSQECVTVRSLFLASPYWRSFSASAKRIVIRFPDVICVYLILSACWSFLPSFYDVVMFDIVFLVTPCQQDTVLEEVRIYSRVSFLLY